MHPSRRSIFPHGALAYPKRSINLAHRPTVPPVFTTAPDGRRMSINVEVLGGSPMVQHYVEDIGERDHLRLVSNSDIFTPTGRIKVGVIWDLSVRKIDEQSCEFTNTVHSSATAE